MSYNKLTNRFKNQFDPVERLKANRKRQWTLYALGLLTMILVALTGLVVFLSVLHLTPIFKGFFL